MNRWWLVLVLLLVSCSPSSRIVDVQLNTDQPLLTATSFGISSSTELSYHVSVDPDRNEYRVTGTLVNPDERSITFFHDYAIGAHTLNFIQDLYFFDSNGALEATNLGKGQWQVKSNTETLYFSYRVSTAEHEASLPNHSPWRGVIPYVYDEKAFFFAIRIGMAFKYHHLFVDRT